MDSYKLFVCLFGYDKSTESARVLSLAAMEELGLIVARLESINIDSAN